MIPETAKRSGLKAAMAVVGMLVVTPLVLLVVYQNVFPRWPWVRFTLILTIITILAAAAITPWESRGRSHIDGALGYGGFIVPFLWLILYPGTRALGIHSDSKAHIALVACAIVHGAAYWLIASDLEAKLHRELESKKSIETTK